MSQPSPLPARVIPIRAVPAAPANDSGAPRMVSLYQKHSKVYPRSVQGWFAKWRWLMVWLTQAVFYGLPWLPWNGRQAGAGCFRAAEMQTLLCYHLNAK